MFGNMPRFVSIELSSDGIGMAGFHKDDHDEVVSVLEAGGLEVSEPLFRDFGRSTTEVLRLSAASGADSRFDKSELVSRFDALGYDTPVRRAGSMERWSSCCDRDSPSEPTFTCTTNNSWTSGEPSSQRPSSCR